MWVATQDGLNRFDGVDFIRFNVGMPLASRRLIGSDVFDVFADSGFVWALTAYGGLNKIDPMTCSVVERYTLSSNSAAPRNWWFKCMEQGTNTIFIGTNEGCLISFDRRSGRSTILTDLNQRSGQRGPIDKLFLDKDGRLWLFISGIGISRIDTADGKEVNFIPLQQLGFMARQGFQFTSLCVAGNHLLIGSTAGLAAIDLNSFRTVDAGSVLPLPVKGFLHTPILALSYRDDRLLLACKQDLLLMNPVAGGFQRISSSRIPEDKDWLMDCNCIYQSREGIWVGSTYGVAWVKNVRTPFTGFYSSMDRSGVRINHGTTLCKINDSICFVCADDGMYRSNEQTGRITRISDPDFFYEAFRVPGHMVIASGQQNGLRLFDEAGNRKNLLAVFPELAPMAGDLLIADARLNDSVIYLASQNQRGIYIWRPFSRRLDVINTDSGFIRLKSNVINRLFFDSHRRLWIVGDDVVSVYDPLEGVIRHLDLINPMTHQPLSINMDVCEANNNFYLTVYGVGIVELNAGLRLSRIYSLQDGINNLGLYKLFPVNDSLILASSNVGLSLVNLHSGHIASYFEEDGLHSDNFEEASGTTYKNYIYLGGIKGYTRIDKGAIPFKETAAPLYFSNVEIQTEKGNIDTLNIRLDGLVVPDNALRVSVGYASLDYLNAKKMVYRYKIKELAGSWISNNIQRFISLTGLSPGSYTLQVETAGENGRWSDRPIEMTLVYLPKWYQTVWFKLLLIGLAMGLISAFFLLRLRQLKEQQRIRREIAGDLHDDIGATLNSLKLLTHMAKKNLPGEQHLNSIEQNLGDAIVRLRDTIWVLDDSADTCNDLMDKLRRFALPMSVCNGIALEWNLQEELKYLRLSKKEKKNLLLIAKEAINNAFKYGECKRVSISICQEHGKLSLFVTDDGKGFDPGEASQGYGLKNILYRARQMRYKASIVSANGKGTTIRAVKQ